MQLKINSFENYPNPKLTYLKVSFYINPTQRNKWEDVERVW